MPDDQSPGPQSTKIVPLRAGQEKPTARFQVGDFALIKRTNQPCVVHKVVNNLGAKPNEYHVQCIGGPSYARRTVAEPDLLPHSPTADDRYTPELVIDVLDRISNGEDQAQAGDVWIVRCPNGTAFVSESAIKHITRAYKKWTQRDG